MIMEKGYISLTATIITAGGLLLASIFTSWTTADKRVGAVEKNVAVVEEREGLHYLETQKQLERMNTSIDKIADKLGVKK